MRQVRLLKQVILGSGRPDGFRVKLEAGTLMNLPDRLAQELVSAGLAKPELERAVLEPPRRPLGERDDD